MLLSVALFVSLTTFLGCVASSTDPNPNHAADVRRPRGLAPRQNIAGVRLGSSNNTSGSGITRLVLASDQSSYYATIAAGNITFRLAVDTASSDTLIASTDCVSNACRSIPKYPLKYQSPTFVSLNGNSTTFNVSYADGTFSSGYVARESVRVANLTVPDQAFGVVNETTVSFTNEISGILGLGFPRLSQIYNTSAHGTPFFSALAQRAIVDYPIFGIYLTRNYTGTLSLGAIDSGVVNNISNIEWHDVVPFAPQGASNNVSSYLYWALQLSSISVNGTSFTPVPTYPSVTPDIGSLAILDVGTPGIYGPYNDVSNIYSLIPGSRLVDEGGQWAIPCDTLVTMSFSFGGQNFTLQPTDYMIGPASGNPNMCLTWPRASPPTPDGVDWQLGSAFLRSVYSIYDYGIDTMEPPIIGLYPLNNQTTLQQNSTFLSSYFSLNTATIATTLPNSLLSPPSYTTPPYAFNTSVVAEPGEIVSSELGTSTYSPMFGTVPTPQPTAIPTVSLTPNVITLLVTNHNSVSTSVSTAMDDQASLGVPYGWTSSGSIGRYTAPSLVTTASLFLLSFVVFSMS
ncbi:acid protease [Thelephora terrestris]|uniref:Acid protease n=1 Tax=Thelephora terrestris TaxID=56493 RepID=A0A9P6H4Y9_9AGAM|nr:acid protease [Thelephora terrestris]